MDKLNMRSMDKCEYNLMKLMELFPNAVTETISGYDDNGKPIIKRAIDKEVLMQEINVDVVDGKEERYHFTWPDKKKSAIKANQAITETLRPDKNKSVLFEKTENIYIEGDNLAVLKLLQETYLGKIKMIYIDPPYNTGNDFIYNDDFSITSEEYEDISGDYDETGNRLVQNTDRNGRYHTDWLNMIYMRLRLAKDLLAKDGCIFISIDDNEMCNLKKICDEIFGASNFFTEIIVQSNKRGQTYKQIARTHEYLLVYTKSEGAEFNELEKDGESDDLNLIDLVGKYNIRELRNRNPKFGRFNRPNLFYSFWVNPNNKDKDGFVPVSLVRDEQFTIEVVPLNSENEESCWRWGTKLAKENMDEDTQKSNLVAKEKQGGGYNIYEKYRKTTYNAKTIWDDTDFITEKGTVELGELGLSKYFDFPKPLALLKRCIKLGSNDGDIILDFFSGSATTAHATMLVNLEENTNRKFIMVQLPEELGERGTDKLHTICDVGEERLRLAGNDIANNESEVDIGFRVLRLDSSNMEDVYYNPAEVKQSSLFAMSENIKEDRTSEDLLFQVMLDLGILLSSKIEEEVIAEKLIYSVANGFLIACFDDVITDELVTEIAKKKPYYAVFRDSGMATDSVATNFEQIFATYSPDTVRRIL